MNRKISIINETFDLNLLLKILKKHYLLSFAIIIAVMVTALLYIRYTPPLYEAKSLMQINEEENPNKILKLGEYANADNIVNMGKTISLMQSKEFIKRCIPLLAFDTRYYVRGTFLDNELYRNSPFEVTHTISNRQLYSTPIFVNFNNDQTIEVWCELNKQTYRQTVKQNTWFEFFENKFKIDIAEPLLLEHEQKHEYQNQYFFCVQPASEIESEILSSLTIRILSQQTQSIEIAYQSKNAAQTADIVNVIIEEFQKYDVEKKSESTKKILNFIDNQLNEIYGSLNRSEADLQNYMKSKNINRYNDTEHILASTTDKINELNNNLVDLEIEHTTLLNIRNDLQNNDTVNTYPMLAMLSGTQTEQIVVAMLTNLQDMLNQKNTLLNDVTANNHRVIKITNQIDSYKQQFVEFLNTLIEQVDRRINNYNSKVKDLTGKIFAQSDNDVVELSRLQRIYSIQENFYNQLVLKKAEYMINQASYISNSTILEKGVTPQTPIFPNRQTILVIALILGIIMVFIINAVIYLFYDDIISPDVIMQYTTTPILGTIPQYKNKLSTSQLLVDKHPNSMFTESFRNIRSNMQFLTQEKGSKTIVVSSTVSGEGKTFIAVNLAGIYAINNKKVLLLDMDLRKPRLHLVFDLTQSKGMSSILSNNSTWQECVTQSAQKGLDYITAGAVPPNPAELALSQKMDEIIEEMKAVYDIIIIDTPPVGIVTDAFVNMQKADYSLYIFKAGVSKRSFISNVTRLISEKKLNNLYIIFNGVQSSSYKRKNNYGYGYYSYGHGYYSEENDGKRKK